MFTTKISALGSRAKLSHDAAVFGRAPTRPDDPMPPVLRGPAIAADRYSGEKKRWKMLLLQPSPALINPPSSYCALRGRAQRPTHSSLLLFSSSSSSSSLL
jgi:hypothetical protein